MPTTLKADPDEKPRTAAAARLREVWDSRLRMRERELLLQLANLPPALNFAIDGDPRKWAQLGPIESQRVLLAFRSLVNLGNEASYALGYTRRNG